MAAKYRILLLPTSQTNKSAKVIGRVSNQQLATGLIIIQKTAKSSAVKKEAVGQPHKRSSEIPEKKINITNAVATLTFVPSVIPHDQVSISTGIP